MSDHARMVKPVDSVIRIERLGLDGKCSAPGAQGLADLQPLILLGVDARIASGRSAVDDLEQLLGSSETGASLQL